MDKFIVPILALFSFFVVLFTFGLYIDFALEKHRQNRCAYNANVYACEVIKVYRPITNPVMTIKPTKESK